jgi:NTP pyrophosphatase (non-canonical NTP hydrolase)
MSALTTSRDAATETYASPLVAISGSFRRDLAGLARVNDTFRELGCMILSPREIDFVSERDGFVFASQDVGQEPSEIEERHLDAIRTADLMWLHASEGYIGTSASFEIGFAHAAGVPIFSDAHVDDVTLREFVTRVPDPGTAVSLVRDGLRSKPGEPLRALQRYYAVAATRRGYDSESLQNILLLITEELGELARAVRKRVGLLREGGYGDESIAEELADLQLYLVHMATAAGIDLALAVTDKERVNRARQDRSTQASA